MSGDHIRRATAGDTAGKTPDERLTPLVRETPDSTRPPADGDAVPDDLTSPSGDPLADGDVAVDDGLVTESLDEILLALIASSARETHGTGLMRALERRFDADLSPGTVYPRLHDLDAEGILERHDLVQTKQYSLSDESVTTERIADAARQHLAIGLFLQASLDAVSDP